MFHPKQILGISRTRGGLHTRRKAVLSSSGLGCGGLKVYPGRPVDRGGRAGDSATDRFAFLIRRLHHDEADGDGGDDHAGGQRDPFDSDEAVIVTDKAANVAKRFHLSRPSIFAWAVLTAAQLF